MSHHANISVFVPHLGCPNMCSFCNQVHISGTAEIPTAQTVERALCGATKSKSYDPTVTELAFFGGSFTAIEREYMLTLLRAGKAALNDGKICGIRISTRPDAISTEILELLKKYGVTAIELGAQSMNDRVLALNRRGHTAMDVVNASNLIKSHGFSLGLQMMTGLYGTTVSDDIETALRFCKIKPDTARIYPTITLKDTYLECLYKAGKYTPQTVEDAAILCEEIKELLEDSGINVIRVGLHSIDPDSFVAGPWHPAFGEMCESVRYLNSFLTLLNNVPQGSYTFFVNPKELSKAIGQKKSNLKKLSSLGYICEVKSDPELDMDQISGPCLK